MSRFIVDLPRQNAFVHAAIAVAVPARNEAASIENCLRALDVAAANATGATVHLVLLVNNSTDRTAEIARAYRAFALNIVVVDVVLEADRAHAGGARRAAFDHALALIPSNGVLMTTDADSCVDANWIAANLAELSAGADAVAGVVAFDTVARRSLPPLPVRALEWRLAALHARLGTLIDPRAHDPWPNHIWAWGASLAITVPAYQQIGGMPAIPLAEDRALAEAIERADLRLRHSHAPVVYTSARSDGRAHGGFADLLHRYKVDDQAPCDAALEPVTDLVRRLLWRARLRRIAAARGVKQAALAATRIGYCGVPHPGFGALWHSVEEQSSTLVRQRVHPATLVDDVSQAERLISRIERRGANRADIPACAIAE